MTDQIIIPSRLQEVFEDNYGEELGFHLPTLPGLMLDSVFNCDPDPDTMEEILESHQGHLGMIDNLLIATTGYSAKTLISEARDYHDDSVSEAIEKNLTDDDTCPFKNTADALDYYNGDILKENETSLARQRTAANDVFDALFGVTAGEMLGSVVAEASSELKKKLQQKQGSGLAPS